MALHDVVLNQVQISKQLKVSRCCVESPIKKYKQLGRFGGLKHTGHPKKLSDPEIRHLQRLIKGDSRLSSRKIAADLNANSLESVTTRTRRRYLKDLAFEYVVKIKKQRLSTHHQQLHIIAWCKQYLNWTKDSRRKVIFSEESALYVLK